MKYKPFGTFWTRTVSSWKVTSNILRGRYSFTDHLALELAQVHGTSTLVPIMKLGFNAIVLHKEDNEVLIKALLQALAVQKQQDGDIPVAPGGDA